MELTNEMRSVLVDEVLTKKEEESRHLHLAMSSKTEEEKNLHLLFNWIAGEGVKVIKEAIQLNRITR